MPGLLQLNNTSVASISPEIGKKLADKANRAGVEEYLPDPTTPLGEVVWRGCSVPAALHEAGDAPSALSATQSTPASARGTRARRV